MDHGKSDITNGHAYPSTIHAQTQLCSYDTDAGCHLPLGKPWPLHVVSSRRATPTETGPSYSHESWCFETVI